MTATQDLCKTKASRRQNPKNLLSLSYIAGFFDGEGSISVSDNNTARRAKSPSHMLRVTLGNTDPRILRWLFKHFGGDLVPRHRYKPNHRAFRQWSLRGPRARDFLVLILPFLQMKREQAKLGIKLQNSKIRRRSKQLSNSTLTFRKNIQTKICKLNAREWPLTLEEQKRAGSRPRKRAS